MRSEQDASRISIEQVNEKMEAYKVFIRDLADKKDSFIFRNGSTEHARIVLQNMYRISSEIVRIYCKEMNPDVYDDSLLIEQIKSYLLRKGRLKIILEKTIHEDSQISKLINSEDYKFQVEIIQNAGEIIHIMENDKKATPVNVCTADGFFYRLEVNTNERVAEGSFNDPTYVQQINTVFDKKYDLLKSKSIN